MDLDKLGQFDQELGITIEMVNLGRFALGEGGHRFEVAPVGDGREPALMFTILPEQLDTKGGFLQRRDSCGFQISLITIRDVRPRSAAPDAGDGRLAVGIGSSFL